MGFPGQRVLHQGHDEFASLAAGALIQKAILTWHTLCNGTGTASRRVHQPSEEKTMFGWAITFLIVAIIAGIFGFAGVAGTATWIAKILFIVGLVVFLVVLATGRHPPTM